MMNPDNRNPQPTGFTPNPSETPPQIITPQQPTTHPVSQPPIPTQQPAAQSQTAMNPENNVQQQATMQPPTVIQPATTPQPMRPTGAIPVPQPTPAQNMGYGPYQQANVPATAPAPQPPNTGQIFAAGGEFTAPPQANNKLPFIIAGTTMAILLIIVGSVFGLYLPNTEANVWKNGLNRSGEALDKIVIDATDPKKIESYKTTDLKGTVVADFPDGSFNGDVNLKFDKKFSNGSATFTVKDSRDDGISETFGGKLLTELPDDSTYPNVYFQYSGLALLGAEFWLPGSSEYEDKWIIADSQYIESLGAGYLGSAGQNEEQPTSNDIAEAVRAVSSVTKEYALTSDPDKSVFVKKEFVGKEKLDEVNAYHYRVGINLKNAQQYCVALSTTVLDTQAYKKFSGDDNTSIKEKKDKAAKDCEESIKNSGIQESDTFDMWIDRKYKLIHKIRVYDKQDKEKYTDIGQIYKGNDDLTLFVAYRDTKANINSKFTLNTNLETNKTTGELQFKNSSEDSPFNVKVTLESTMTADPVQIDKPENPISIQEIIQKMEAASQVQEQTFSSDFSDESFYQDENFTDFSGQTFDNY